MWKFNEHSENNGENMDTFVIMNNFKNNQIATSILLLLSHGGRGYSQLLSFVTIVKSNAEIWTKMFDWRVKK